MRLYLFLAIIGTAFCCYQLPVSESSLSNCLSKGTSLVCDVETVASSIMVLATGGCAEFQVTGYQNNIPVVPVEPFLIQFKIDNYVHACDLQASCVVADLAIMSDVVCDCPGHAGSRCTTSAGLDLDCSDHCSSSIEQNYPYASVCSKDSFGKGCSALADFAFWCGCVYAEGTTSYWVSRVAGCQPVWQLEVSVGNNSKVINAPVDFDIGVYDLGGVNFTWSVEQFAYPQFPTDAGNLVYKGAGNDGYLIEGICSCDAPCDPTLPGWFRRFGPTFEWDNQAFKESLGWDDSVRSRHDACVNNDNAVTTQQKNIASLLTQNNEINTKLQGIFTINSIGPGFNSSYLNLNQVSPTSAFLQLQISAKSVEFVYQESVVTIKSCGSDSVCGYDNKGGWLIASVQQAGVDLVTIYCDNTSYIINPIYFITDGNYSFSMPCSVLGGNATISDNQGNTCTFQPTCWNFNPASDPIGPPIHTGSGGSDSGITSQDWTFIFLIIIFVLGSLLCCCALMRV